MSIVFFGTPEFAVPSLKALISSGEKIGVVITQPDKPRGRGHRVPFTPVKDLALSQGLRVLQPERLRDETFVNELRTLQPKFIIVVAYGRILPKAILDIPKIAPINVHASLLPKYRGASPVQWAIINGEKETGVTTMFMSEGLDEGDILLQERLGISDEDTAESLGKSLSLIGADLLVKTLKGLRNGSIKRTPQSGAPSFAPPFKKHDGKIDWSKTAKGLFNFIRGMHPWPGAYCMIGDETVKVSKARPIEGAGVPGRVEQATKDSLIIGTGEGLLAIMELQPGSKKAMHIASFLQGRKIKEGTQLK